MNTNTPKQAGFYFPAEWHQHRATWLTFPIHPITFPDCYNEAINEYLLLIKSIAASEQVRLNAALRYHSTIEALLAQYNIDKDRVTLFDSPSNDVWCRDHGPAFLLNHKGDRAAINWNFNAWGGKYPYALDNSIPTRSLRQLYPDIKIYHPNIVMEGGSIDVNGQGDLLTTRACLLNTNRNPHLTQAQIEAYLQAYYNVDKVHFLDDGIAGDDTDGHVDDITRFIAPDKIVTVVEQNKQSANYQPLQDNLKLLQSLRLNSGKQADIIELPMPTPLYYDGNILPASYANFYFTNDSLIMPIFNCPNDQKAIDIMQQALPNRKIIALSAQYIIRGLGSFHCLTQQEV